ncbi:unnamed protein product, partial [Cyprideis torosa]
MMVSRRFLSRMASATAPRPASSSAPKTAILMLNMGGPRKVEEVSDFLHRLFTDGDIIKLPAQKALGSWIARRKCFDFFQFFWCSATCLETMMVSRRFLSRMASATAPRPASSSAPKTAILMLNMGGPRKVEEVSDFLHRLFTDGDIIKLPAQKALGSWIARRRTPVIQQKYSEIGGGSPISKWTDLQGQLLCDTLNQSIPEYGPFKHYLGFRYAHPLLEDTIPQMAQDGIEHVVAFSQYPQYSCATSGSSFNALHKYFSSGNSSPFKWSIIDRWATQPHLAKAFADLIRSELDKFPENIRRQFVLLFSAHSLPMRAVNRGDPYPAEVAATVNLVMRELGYPNPYRLVWQSKVGPLPWLSPTTEEAMKGLVERGRSHQMLIPIAFTSDHIETLHEMDIEYGKEYAEKIGLKTFARCPAPNDHPEFIRALVSEVEDHFQKKQWIRPQ